MCIQPKKDLMASVLVAANASELFCTAYWIRRLPSTNFEEQNRSATDGDSRFFELHINAQNNQDCKGIELTHLSSAEELN